MIPYIENYENPQIGDFFMVKTVKFKRNNVIFEWPVFADSHTDEGVGQEKEHYHVDWRFMDNKYILEQRMTFRRHYPGGWGFATETENYAPILKEDMIEESIKSWQYKRDFKLPNKYEFIEVTKEMLACGAKMKKMRCPHHGTNLTSCKPVDGVVTCPQHGLKWNVNTGELVHGLLC
jgi:hypothetical protein